MGLLQNILLEYLVIGGTGKTTLMRLIEKNLRPKIFTFNTKELDSTEVNEFKNYLKNFKETQWLFEDTIRINQSYENQNKKLIYKTSENRSISLELNKEETKTIFYFR